MTQPTNAPVLTFKDPAPTTAAAVTDFTKANPDAVPAPEAPAQPAIEIKPNEEFDVPASDAVHRSGLVDTRLTGVTADEKFAYMKSLLVDEPFSLPVELFNGHMRFQVRTRRLVEQERINDLLHEEFYKGKADRITPNEVSMCAHRTQQYLVIVMVQRINDVAINAPTIGRGTIEEDLAATAKFIAETFDTMSVTRWTALSNAVRIFESKAAKLATEAANESFWPPLK